MEDFETLLGYSFKDKNLLRTSLVHSSYAYENTTQSNERLEFLGDAALELASSLYLYKRYPKLPEGELTKLRAAAVCEPSLARAARGLMLSDRLLLGKGEAATGGRERDSILSDALEAVIGAAFLDGGMNATCKITERLLGEYISDLYLTRGFGDYKTSLQELLQQRSQEPIVYSIVSEQGPDHNKSFTAEVRHGQTVLGYGSGRSKKEAEQQAAFAALKQCEGTDSKLCERSS
jgi:ribonuclease-3